MAKRAGKNPYVHPDPDKRMYNQAGNDGYSFDEPYDKGDEFEHDSFSRAVPPERPRRRSEWPEQPQHEKLPVPEPRPGDPDYEEPDSGFEL